MATKSELESKTYINLERELKEQRQLIGALVMRLGGSVELTRTEVQNIMDFRLVIEQSDNLAENKVYLRVVS